MAAEQPQKIEDEHRVVAFRPRSEVRRPATGAGTAPGTASPPGVVKGFARYEGGEDQDDYRHRMLVNLAALIVTILLALAGGWLAMQIAEMRKNQDCVLSGRRNCTPVSFHRSER
ncbi:MAG: hypothetical protein ACJ8F3_13500 [Xanthobacteraceae bacterium]